MLTKSQIKQLLRKHINDTISPQELESLFTYLKNGEQSDDWKDVIAELSKEPQISSTYDEESWESVIQEILSPSAVIPIQRRSVVYYLRKAGWAAAILVLFCTGIYFWFQRREVQHPLAESKTYQNKIQPGRDGAILTLSDGRQIVLDSMGNGLISTEDGMEVKLTDKQVQYASKGIAYNDTTIAYNTLTTPRGRQFQLALPDGTKAWLNAASSITYPTRFVGNERKVIIEGEVYFEVAGNPAIPFKVMARNSAVEVLGTHFNINAYDDEASINTTLLEGAVKISSSGKMLLLKPGQQAQVSNNNIDLVKNADTEQSVAWKNGMFSFTQASLPTVMRQLARWYNVEVDYTGAIPEREFTGDIGRSLTWEQVLRILAKNKVNFRMEDNNKISILQ